ncbi:hypothetical protein [Methylibium sp.]|nr:hypothetical protein [Methylibium sp.]
MSNLDDDLKAHARRNLITWMNYTATFLAGAAMGILVAIAFG